MKLLASAIALSIPLSVSALEAPKFDAKRLSDEVRTLSSDAFEGRGPATAGEEKTIAYVTEQFKAAGLQPGGDLVDGPPRDDTRRAEPDPTEGNSPREPHG